MRLGGKGTTGLGTAALAGRRSAVDQQNNALFLHYGDGTRGAAEVLDSPGARLAGLNRRRRASGPPPAAAPPLCPPPLPPTPTGGEFDWGGMPVKA